MAWGLARSSCFVKEDGRGFSPGDAYRAADSYRSISGSCLRLWLIGLWLIGLWLLRGYEYDFVRAVVFAAEVDLKPVFIARYCVDAKRCGEVAYRFV